LGTRWCCFGEKVEIRRGWIMNMRLNILMLGALLAGVGCQRRAAQASLPNLAIPVGCASEITFLHCDARVNPPKCESARVKYRNGCAEIVVKPGEHGGSMF
jgi:hypothetical protein